MARAGLRNPASVSVEAHRMTAPRNEVSNNVDNIGEQSVMPCELQNVYTVCPQVDRLRALLTFLRKVCGIDGGKAIVFVSTCASVDYFGKVLPLLPKNELGLQNIKLYAMHGRMPQKRRYGVLSTFTVSATLQGRNEEPQITFSDPPLFCFCLY